MPTAPSSTEVNAWSGHVADLRSLLDFRLASARRKGSRRLRIAALVLLGITLAAGLLPAFLDGAGAPDGQARDVLDLLAVGFAAFLALTVLSSVASGGGRELIAKDQAVGYPISPVTDHLGALVMAPLNIAWLVQGWVLLGATAYAVGPAGLWLAQPVVLAWLLVATAAGQVVGWTMEALRRRPHGTLMFRAVSLGAVAVFAALVVTDRLTTVLDHLPTDRLVDTIGRVGDGPTVAWLVTVVGLLAAFLALVLLGVVPATAAGRRLPRDEARLEGGTYPARPHPTSDLAALVRMDMGSVLRSVPLRRGLLTLALLPGGIALAGDLTWTMIVLMPGLVASGSTLLFGVNAWCLDGRGGLWRESLPVAPRLVFWSRALVLTGLLLLASVVTLALAALRAGTPSAAELAAVLGTWVVVTGQVVSASMRWSMANPFPVDLRSARATPAPPGVMVGYSARLALGTTLVGMLFSGLTVFPWVASVVVALPFVLVSVTRIRRARASWEDPAARSRVVVTVAA